MMKTYVIQLRTPATEMAREEIGKQAPFVSPYLSRLRFLDDGSRIEYEAPEENGDRLAEQLAAVADKTARALRSLERKIVFKSAAMDRSHVSESKAIDYKGVHFLGDGQVALSGVPLRLMRYFDRIFESFGGEWSAEPIITPTLIPTKTLSKCDYFRSFPHTVTFAAHLREEADTIADFRARHQELDDIDSNAIADMSAPTACLSPAVCYHVYKLYEGQSLSEQGVAHGIAGKCFRFESSNLSDLRRLWDFTMREVVFLGGRDAVLKRRERSLDMMSAILDEHALAGEIRTASDPFFVAPDAISKTYFQLSSDSKYEISLELPGNERLAVGSHNYHSDFFGRVFDVEIDGAGPMHSVCVAFGLERWVHAFIQQHGEQPASWPKVVREAAEFSGTW